MTAIVLFAACQFDGSSAGGTDGGTGGGTEGGEGPAWYAGAMQSLPVLSDDLAAFVDALPHPEEGGYVAFEPERTDAFDTFLVQLGATLTEAREDPDGADFCNLASAAAAAGYALFRFYDTTGERWYLYARDDTGEGHAHLFVDADPRRDLVLEAPHDPADLRTGVQGARIFRRLGGRALLVNGDHRCSSTTLTTCSGTTEQCGGWYRESDVAHHVDNAFHRAHVWLTDGYPDARFAQLHGMKGSASELANIGDGTFNLQDTESVANQMSAALKVRGPDAEFVFSCQGGEPPPSGLCGATNVQARYTNDPAGMACDDSTGNSSGRFLHIEQHQTLRDDDEGDGWSWQDVSDALADVWSECLDGCGAQPAQPGPDALTGLDCG